MSTRLSYAAVLALLLFEAAALPASAQEAAATGEKPEKGKPNGDNDTPQEQQAQAKKGKPIATSDVVRANLEPAYIAYPFSLSGLDPLIFESNVVAHFFVNRPDWPFAIVLTPKILVRMFNEDSSPVKSPSYMPRVTAFVWFQQEVQDDAPTVYASVMLSHHSNGQSGKFLNDNGEINHDGGSFSTNYLEFTAYGTGFWRPWFAWSSLSLEWHPGFNEDPELKGRYGLTRLHFASTVLANLPLKGQVNLRVSAILSGFQKTSTTPWMREIERFPISLRYTITVPGIDLGLYLGYYLGHDYYNIYFDRVIHTIQIGISGGVTPSLSDQ
jgi:hypothetical protein